MISVEFANDLRDTLQTPRGRHNGIDPASAGQIYKWIVKLIGEYESWRGDIDTNTQAFQKWVHGVIAAAEKLDSTLREGDARFRPDPALYPDWMSFFSYAPRVQADIKSLIEEVRWWEGRRQARRPPDLARRRLEAEIARLLHTRGLKPTTAPDGIFAAVLRLVHHEVGIAERDLTYSLRAACKTLR